MAHPGPEHAPRENAAHRLQPAARHGRSRRPSAVSGYRNRKRQPQAKEAKLLAERWITPAAPPGEGGAEPGRSKGSAELARFSAPGQVQTGALDSRAKREGASQSPAEAVNGRSRGGIHSSGCFTLSGLSEATPVRWGPRGGQRLRRKVGDAAHVLGKPPGGLQPYVPPVPIWVGVTDYAKGSRGPGRGAPCPGSHGAQASSAAV